MAHTDFLSSSAALLACFFLSIGTCGGIEIGECQHGSVPLAPNRTLTLTCEELDPTADIDWVIYKHSGATTTVWYTGQCTAYLNASFCTVDEQEMKVSLLRPSPGDRSLLVVVRAPQTLDGYTVRCSVMPPMSPIQSSCKFRMLDSTAPHATEESVTPPHTLFPEPTPFPSTWQPDETTGIPPTQTHAVTTSTTAKSTPPLPSSTCIDITSPVTCNQLPDICSSDYAYVICPKYCNLCGCENHLPPGFTCEGLMGVLRLSKDQLCADTVGRWTCQQFCGCQFYSSTAR